MHSSERSLLAVRIPSLIIALVFAAAAPVAFAAHPLQTEDTGTQGAGNLEIENGLSRARHDSTTQTVYQPQFSLGLLTTLDAIVQPAFAKWRFWGSDPLSLAIRAGVELSTNDHGFGLTHGKKSEHALLALTWDHAPTTVHLNLGTTVVPRAAATPARRSMISASAAVMQQIDEHLILTLDATLGQSPNPRQGPWPGTVLAGAIWTVNPGLDLDVGWQRSVRDQPVARTWLAGLTYRFSL